MLWLLDLPVFGHFLYENLNAATDLFRREAKVLLEGMDFRKILYTLLYFRSVELRFGGIIALIEGKKHVAELRSNSAEALLVEVLSISSIDTAGLTHCRRGDS
jgi:hypothetical protein